MKTARRKPGGTVFVALIAGGCVGGCTEEVLHPDLLYPPIYSSETLIVRANPELDLCGGSIEYLDAFVPWLASTLPPGTRLQGPVTYQFLQGDELYGELRCSQQAWVCARGGVVFARDGVDLHEMTHAVRQQAYDWNPPAPVVLEEGIAALYSDAYLEQMPSRLNESDLEIIDSSDVLTQELYAPSAHFLAYLHERTGARGLTDFLEASSEIGDVSDYSHVYGQATGRDWNADFVAYDSYPSCEPWSAVHRPVECSDDQRAVPLAVDTQMEVSFTDFGCSHPDAIGPIDGRVWGYLPVDISPLAVDPRYDVTLTSSRETELEVQFVSCDGGCRGEDSRATRLGTQINRRIEFRPGRNTIRFSIPADVRSDLGFRFIYRGP